MRVFLRIVLAPLFLLVYLSGVHAQSTVRGIVKNQYDDPLSFASIYIDELNTGIATNEEGYYEVQLPDGTYTFTFQYLGYRTKSERFDVKAKGIDRDVVLRDVAFQLQTVVITDSDEDPAYSIMRKAIAKAKYHTQQLDWHQSTVYIKSSFRTDQIPKLFRKRLEKEGVDTAGAFTEEGISEITFTRPNEWHEKVISRRTIGGRKDENPLIGLTGSLYQDKWGDMITPFSPKAFAYYRFEYEGFFEENGYVIDKIKVTPRGSKQNLLEGHLYIVDQLWAIYSSELTLYTLNFKYKIRQIYQPIEPRVWLPINHKIEFKGKIFGFGIDISYFITHTNYAIKLNPDLEYEPEIVDIETETDEEVVEKMTQSELDKVLEDIGDKEKFSNKDMRRLMKAYEKEEKEEARRDTLKNVEAIRVVEIDSAAYDRDSTYWEAIRPIPLTKYEEIGYARYDSIYEEEKDTLGYMLKPNYTYINNRFQIDHILGGGTYKIGNNAYGGWKAIWQNVHFNTVEGWHVALPFRFFNQYKEDHWYWSVNPELHYSFSRERLNGQLMARIRKRQDESYDDFYINIGRRTKQFNADAVHPFVNDVYSLLLERNYLKLYEREFIDIKYTHQFNNRIRVGLAYSHALNRHLDNNANNLIFNSDRRVYTSNDPFNRALGGITGFDTYKSGRLSFDMAYYPWLVSNKYNGRKRPDYSSSPRLNFSFNQSVQIDEDSPEYSQWEFGIKHRFEVGAGSIFRVNLLNGGFWNSDNLRLAELKHFDGNRTDIIQTRINESFKLLDYYEFSTASDYYFEAHLDYEFRELLLTRIVWLQLLGIKENVSLGWLETNELDHYAEVAYGINNILRFLKVEAVASYEDFDIKDWGIRIGLSVDLD